MTLPSFQYEQDGTVFRQDALVTFGQCDAYGRLKLCELLVLLTDTAGLDFEQRGMSHDYLLEHDIAFLVSRLSLRFFRDLHHGDRLSVRTWENGSRGSQFYRCFQVSGQEGDVVVNGMSAWATVVPSTRRILRPTDLSLPGRSVVERTVDCAPCEHLREPEGLEPLGARTVQWDDLDANGHVNNARYAAFVLDALSGDQQCLSLGDVRLTFSHEARPGDVLALRGGPCAGGREAFVAGSHQRGPCFSCSLSFR